MLENLPLSAIEKNDHPARREGRNGSSNMRIEAEYLQIENANNNLDIHQDKSSTHPEKSSTHPPKIILGVYPFYPAPCVPGAYLKWAASDCMHRRDRGLMCTDLVRGRYKCVRTLKQAKNLLHLHKKKGALLTKQTMTMPQQYFATRDDVEAAELMEETSTHPEASVYRIAPNSHGIRQVSARKQEEVSSEEEGKLLLAEMAYSRKQEEKLVTDFGKLLTVAASKSRRVGLCWGIHNVRIDLIVPPEVYCSDKELCRIAPVQVHIRQKPRKLSIKIDDFIIPILFYSNGRITIRIGASDQPFPVSDMPDRVTASLTAMAGEIRSRLCSILTGSGGNRIVPPVHKWRLMQLDLNTDVRVSAGIFVNAMNVQLELADDIILGVYRKEMDNLDSDHHRYVRVEDRGHQFKSSIDGRNGTFLDDTVGEVVTSSVERFRHELAKAGEEADNWDR